MLHTRVVVTGYTNGGSSRTEDRGAKFRDELDIERVKRELVEKLKQFYPHVKATTYEAG